MVREAPSPELPTELQGGRFHVLSLLARGSQGVTLVAEDRKRGGRVAIKRFQVHGAPSWKQVELAEREAGVLSTLSHPNLPAYVTHFEEAGALYLVMELVEGKTLAELKRDGALSQRDVLAFMTSIAATLRYLHGRAPPLIHRDVKPGNVIRRPNGSFVLVDFGSVRDKLRPEGGSTVVGTFGYMAPEQFQGRALPATDAYGLGATAIACLTGEDPENLPHQGLAIDVRAALAGRCDARLIALLERLLAPEPERRPRDLVATMATLERPKKPAPGRKHETQHAASSREPQPSKGRIFAVAWLAALITVYGAVSENGVILRLAILPFFALAYLTWKRSQSKTESTEPAQQRMRVEPGPVESDIDAAARELDEVLEDADHERQRATKR